MTYMTKEINGAIRIMTTYDDNGKLVSESSAIWNPITNEWITDEMFAAARAKAEEERLEMLRKWEEENPGANERMEATIKRDSGVEVGEYRVLY